MFTIDSNNQVSTIDGRPVERDITDPAYRDFLYWQAHGKHPSPLSVAPLPVEEPVKEPKEPEPRWLPKVNVDLPVI